MEQIIVTIDTEAEVNIEVKGHSGPGCQKLTEDLEKALGETTKDSRNHEFHQQRQRTSVRTGHSN
jgi:hypothetical protein